MAVFKMSPIENIILGSTVRMRVAKLITTNIQRCLILLYGHLYSDLSDRLYKKLFAIYLSNKINVKYVLLAFRNALRKLPSQQIPLFLVIRILLTVHHNSGPEFVSGIGVSRYWERNLLLFLVPHILRSVQAKLIVTY